MIFRFLQNKKVRALKALIARKKTAARILVVRNDGLGDFILTIPLLSNLKAAFPDAKLYVLIHKRVHNLVPALPDIDGCIIDEGVLLKRDTRKKDSLAVKSAREALRRELMVYRFDFAILAYSEASTSALVKEAGIPWRMGTSRRWYSYRFNLWNSDSRQKSNKSEYNLNLGFLKYLNVRHGYAGVNFSLPPGTLPVKLHDEYIVMHAYKRSGTALVWPIENFKELAEHFLRQKIQVVVIGDRQDEEILRKYFSNLKNVLIVTGTSLLQTARIIAGALHFFGNSSGPLHLSALTKTPHTGVFPQNAASSALRWRTLPFEPSPAERKNFLLQTNFPVDCRVCYGPKCSYYPCTEKITTAQMVEAFSLWQATQNGTNSAVEKKNLRSKLKNLRKKVVDRARGLSAGSVKKKKK